MIGNLFVVTFSSVSATTSGQSDLFQITAPTNSRVELCEYEVTNLSTAPGSISLQLIRGSTTSGSGGTSPVPARAQPWSATAGSSVMANNTTLASSANTETMHSAALAPAEPNYVYRPLDDVFNGRRGSERVFLEAGQRCVLRAGTPSTATPLSGTLKFREIGTI